MPDWDEMSPRERDALVAEEVMEMTPCPHYERVNFGAAGGPMLQRDNEACDCDGETYPEDAIGSIHGTIGGCPHFTTDISAAWRVVEEMRDDDYWFKLLIDYSPERVKATCRGEVSSFRDSDRVPEAICLAALRAKGVSV